MTKEQADRLKIAASRAEKALTTLLAASECIADNEETEYWKNTVQQALSCGIVNLTYVADAALVA